MVCIEFLPNDFGSSKPSADIDNGHLPSFPIINNPLNDDNYTIVALAQNCAATQIQAIWRGIFCRKCKYDSFLELNINRCSESKHDRKTDGRVAAALTIQKKWRRYTTIISAAEKLTTSERPEVSNSAPMSEEKKNVSLQTDLYDIGISSLELGGMEEGRAANLSRLNASSTRKEVVKCANEFCCSNNRDAIELNGFEILNVLRAMSFLQPKEYEILLKTLLSSSNNNSGHKLGDTLRFNLKLMSSLEEFEKDIHSAWKILTRKTAEVSQSSTTLIRRKRNRFKLNSSSQVALSHLQKLVKLTDESLSILELNENVMLYGDATIEAFLTSMGLEVDGGSRDIIHGTLVDQLEAMLKKAENSFIRVRVESALEVVQFISLWERTSGKYSHPLGLGRNEQTFESFESILKAKNLVISKLENELEELRQKIKSNRDHICSCNKEGKKDSKSNHLKLYSARFLSFIIFFPAPFKVLQVENNSNDLKMKKDNLSKEKSTQRRITKQSTSPTNRSHTSRKPMVKQKQKRQESLNRVEIKFEDLFEKDSSKPPPIPLATTANRAKSSYPSERGRIMKNGVDKSSPPYRDTRSKLNGNLTLAQTINKAREKRASYYTSKVAWSNESEARREYTIPSRDNYDSRQNTSLFTKVSRNAQKSSFADTKSNREGKPDTKIPGEENIAPDMRFNAILEKLRRTTAELGKPKR